MSDQATAFAQAATARAAIADIIDKVRTGEFDLATAFAAGDVEPLTGRCFAVKVIEVVPDIGKVRARRAMAEVEIADDAWLQDVTTAQRSAIISALGLGVTARPVTFVLSGPGGVGKGTVVEQLLRQVNNLWLSRSWTTRDPRPGEALDAYNFVDRAAFDTHIKNDGFLEWVEFLDYLQGTPIPAPPPGNDVLLEIDIQGAAQVKAMDPNAVLLFLDAPSAEEQERRLRSRGDSDERVAQRLETAIAERRGAEELGCIIVINDQLQATVAELATIIARHRA